MSTIYSAGQYDDAFTPKRLGNWETAAKQSCPFRKATKLHIPKVIVDSRGHLLPWVPRGDKASSWGLLNFHLRNKYRSRSMTIMSGPGKQSTKTNDQSESSLIQKRLKKLPKYAPRRIENLPPPDLLLEYLKHLRLPIVWIIGPSTRNTFQKRKQFSKQLAANLGFGYVNLDEKIQEWKERQQICTCGGSSNSVISSSACVPPLSPPHGPLHSLAQTSIAPSKLPTNVPPFISPNIPSPSLEASGVADCSEYILKILESQRITFDTALPIERNKILELYKFAMAECLPCEGFIMDSVPFDLVEGLQFEKVFYPTALAIYFTEGVPQKKQKMKPKDRRVTANAVTSIPSVRKVLMTPLDYLEKGRKHNENVYLKSKSHKRLGVFNLVEGEKICKQFGSKTIRIINAEDVERDTMEFLNELVKKNLNLYQQIIEGNAKLDFGVDDPDQYIPSSAISAPVSSAYSSSFILDDGKNVLLKKEKLAEIPRYHREDTTVASKNMPPALVTAFHSETSLFTLPNIFSTSESSSSVASSVPMSPRQVPLDEHVVVDAAVAVEHEEVEKVENVQIGGKFEDEFNATSVQASEPSIFDNNVHKDSGGAGDHADHSISHILSAAGVPEGRKSAELWERIVKLESKVAELKTPEECSFLKIQDKQSAKPDAEDVDADVLPPPTAYAEDGDYEKFEKEEEEKFTATIRNAIGSNYAAAGTAYHNYQQQQQESQNTLPQNYQHPHGQHLIDYDYGASGDCGQLIPNSDGTLPQRYDCNAYSNYQHHCQQNETLIVSKNQQKKRTQTKYLQQSYDSNNNSHSTHQQDPFYDD